MLTRVWPVILIAFFLSTPVTWAELTADQVAIIANRNSAESQAVAWHYAERRGLKREQIITLDLPKDETITREDYEQEVVRPLRRILEERKLAARIKCLVTTYGVPLHIRAPEPTSKEQRWAKDAAVRKEQALVHLGSLERQIKDIGAPASPDGSRAESPEIAPANPSSLNRVTLAIQEAAQRVNATTDLEKAQKDRQALSGLIQQFGGTAALLQFIPTVAPEESEKYRRQGTTAQAIVRVLSSAPSDRNRERAYGLAKEVFGLRGTLTLAEDELLRFSYNEGDASLDSELTLVWWDLGTYRIAGRIPNPLFHNANPGVDKTSRSETELPVLMVTRLDAPTAELAMRLVDRALEAEQRGLEGKVYLDAQGMENSSTMSSGFYDQSLRDSAL